MIASASYCQKDSNADEGKLIFPTWPNLAEKTAVFDAQPWDWDVTVEEIARLAAIPKKTRRKMVENADMKWNVYSAVKGQNWFHAVSKENPSAVILAFVADYDLPITFEFVSRACEERARLGGWVPTHIETSLSGHVRCLWQFERPVLVDGIKFSDEFLKEMGKILEVRSLLPGLDPKSFDCAMRWTNGGYWHVLDYAKPVPVSLAVGICIKLATSLSEKTVDLPLDKLAELMLAKYPRFSQFHGGQLAIGRSGIRFWEATADNPNGAMVVDRGFACVTGDRPMVSWEDLLTKSAVEGLRMTNYGDAADGFYWDGKSYYEKRRGFFEDISRTDILLRIAAHGFSRSRDKYEELSPAEKVLNYIQTEKRVNGAAPLLFRPEGVVAYQNKRILNISDARPIPPSDKRDSGPADFPFLWGFFDVFFASPELNPRDYFFAHWRRFYQGALAHSPLNGQAIFICGPRDCGKNLVSELIYPMSMGGAAPNPYRYLMGDTSFSDNIFNSPVLAINDEDAPPDHKRVVFEQKMKGIVANNVQSYHPKFMREVMIEWCGRLICTLNIGPKDVGLLPMLNQNTHDKMMFFQAQSHGFKFYDKYTNREIVAKELPFLLRWLMDTFRPADGIEIPGRMGVESFFDPFLVQINRQEHISYNLLELLAAWMSSKKWNAGAGVWTGTPTDLLRAMAADATLDSLTKTWEPRKLSLALGDLAKSQTAGVDSDPKHNGRKYILRRDAILAAVHGKAATPNFESLDPPPPAADPDEDGPF